jgi:hypothetical protein
MLEAIMPLPREETTPPVTKIYFVCRFALPIVIQQSYVKLNIKKGFSRGAGEPKIDLEPC